MAAEWIGQVKRAGLAAAGELVGVKRRGKGWGPCPACRADRRGSEDSRPPLTSNDSVGWRCWACGAHGDPADLLAYAVAEKRLDECSPGEKDAVRERAEAAGIVRDGQRGAPLPARRAGAPGPGRPGAPGRPGGGAGAATRKVTVALPGRPGQGAPASVEVEVDDDAPADGDGPEDRRWLGSVFHPGLAAECTARLWDDPDAESVRRYLLNGPGAGPGGTDGRRLTEAAVRKWKLGAYRSPDGLWWATIPLLESHTGDVVNVKFCRVPTESGVRRKPKYFNCPGRPLPLFGARALSNDLGAPVIVVEGELDVVAMWCYGWERSVVSGTSGAGSFADDWLDVLEPFERFVLFLDDDEKGDEGAALLMEKLGRGRCDRARPPLKDASEAWAASVPEEQVRRAIDHAEAGTGMRVVRAGSLIDRLEARISGRATSMFGIPTGSERLDTLYGGWWPGVNVVIGPTGTGKTTLTTWSLWEAARRECPALITSFEQNPDETLEKLMRMQLGGNFLDYTIADRAAAAAAMERTPLHIVDHYGRAHLADVIETLQRYRRRHGVRLALVDHLGFLVDSSKDDERRQIDHAIRELAIVGRSDDIAIVLIVHPDKAHRKGDGRRVRLGDSKGASSIEQDATLGLVLERDARVKVPHCVAIVDKLRKEFGKGAGSSGLLYFDPVACLYADSWGMLPISEREPAPREPEAETTRQPDAATRAAGGDG